MKKMIIYLVVILCLAMLLLTYINLKRFALIDYSEVNVSLKVDNYLAFNVDNDALYFGTIPPFGHGFRDIEIHNEKERRTRVFLESDGYLSNWIIFSPENTFYLDDGEKRNIKVNITVPGDAEFRVYNDSKIKIYFYGA